MNYNSSSTGVTTWSRTHVVWFVWLFVRDCCHIALEIDKIRTLLLLVGAKWKSGRTHESLHYKHGTETFAACLLSAANGTLFVKKKLEFVVTVKVSVKVRVRCRH